MRSFRWLLLATTISLAFFPSLTFAQTPKPTFAMQVQIQARLQNGSLAPRGSLCELEVQNGQMLEPEQMDSSGKCRFVPSAHEIYLIRIKVPGYLKATEKVDLQNSRTGMASHVLSPDPHQAPPEPAGNAKARTVSAIDLSVPKRARKEVEFAPQSLQAHDWDAGITHLKKGIELHGHLPQAYTMLGTALNEQKKWKDAQNALEKAVQLAPKGRVVPSLERL
jgi:tetratricopeptide (TPR) repeat protein